MRTRKKERKEIKTELDGKKTVIDEKLGKKHNKTIIVVITTTTTIGNCSVIHVPTPFSH